VLVKLLDVRNHTGKSIFLVMHGWSAVGGLAGGGESGRRIDASGPCPEQCGNWATEARGTERTLTQGEEEHGLTAEEIRYDH